MMISATLLISLKRYIGEAKFAYPRVLDDQKLSEDNHKL